MLDIDHKPQQALPSYGNEYPVWDIDEMHGHGSARVERVRSDIFWHKDESGCSNMNGISLLDRDDV